MFCFKHRYMVYSLKKEEFLMSHVTGTSFTLIVVLFILLVIVGSAYTF
ncbi:YjcZ family sporulation protein [Halalkalibacter kiskunsagensis]|uniref:YjcZ family sporulation protein n=1 Tax=Halalkalibacter kiskunsagensis TaxID=1548599 RepID=A0ABV6KAV8_9BACI